MTTAFPLIVTGSLTVGTGDEAGAYTGVKLKQYQGGLHT